MSFFGFLRIRARKNVAIRDRIRVMNAYETAPAGPMTAPVTIFSPRSPVEPVMIIPREAKAIDAVIPSKNPTITMI